MRTTMQPLTGRGGRTLALAVSSRRACTPASTAWLHTSSPVASTSTPPPPKKQPAPAPPTPTTREQELKQLEQGSNKPPPYLSRALGVKERPKARKQTKEEWKLDLLNRDKRLAERKHLVKEVSKGYFNDYNELRHQGGKTWMAPTTLIREDVSLYFPDIEGKAVSTSEETHTTNLFPGKVSLVSVVSFKSAEDHINSFTRSVLGSLEKEPNFQYVQINVQENVLKSLMVKMFMSSLRRSVPTQHQPTYLVSSQSLEYLRVPMGMTNKHVGYVYLVDWEGRVRWAGCGWATSDEELGLGRCAGVLVERLKELKKK